MKQINESGEKATAAYNEEGEIVFLSNLKQVAKFVKIPPNVISKAMPHNIAKYHK